MRQKKLEDMPDKEKTKVLEAKAKDMKKSPVEQDLENETKKKATEAMKKLQVDASDAKVEADEKAAVANAKKLGKESTEEVKKTEIQTELKATAKK